MSLLVLSLEKILYDLKYEIDKLTICICLCLWGGWGLCVWGGGSVRLKGISVVLSQLSSETIGHSYDVALTNCVLVTLKIK